MRMRTYMIGIILSPLFFFYHSFTLLISFFLSRIYLFSEKFFQSILLILRAIIFYLNVRSLCREFIFIGAHAFSTHDIRFLISLFLIYGFWKIGSEFCFVLSEENRWQKKNHNRKNWIFTIGEKARCKTLVQQTRDPWFCCLLQFTFLVLQWPLN